MSERATLSLELFRDQVMITCASAPGDADDNTIVLDWADAVLAARLILNAADLREQIHPHRTVRLTAAWTDPP